MFDRNLVLSILMQIDAALQKIVDRARRFRSADDFAAPPSGMEALDSICMVFIAVGEALKHIDKITGGQLFQNTPKSTGKAPWASETSSPTIISISTRSKSSGFVTANWSHCSLLSGR